MAAKKNHTQENCLTYNVPNETIYGTLNRLEWVKKFITKDQLLIDIGCGTGSMMTIPLILQGYSITGYDLDQKSIDYGKKLLCMNNIDENCLICCNVGTLKLQQDGIILSQVLEHLGDKELNDILTLSYSLLKPGGVLLITVPNGYGLFELESFLWNKVGIGKLLGFLKITNIIAKIKNLIFGKLETEHPSSLDSSPHVQRFSYRSIEKKLKKHHFIIKHKQGGSFMSGPFSNLLFTGIKSVMKINLFLGRSLPFLASDFYIAAQKPKE